MTDQEVLNILHNLDDGRPLPPEAKSSLPAIRQLSLPDATRLPASLATLENLQSLAITGKSLTDLTPLRGLASLTFLSVNGTKVKDLSPLQGLTSLQYLDLSENESLTDLRPLASLTSLYYLRLPGSAAANLTPLSGLRSLTYLDLSRSPNLTDLQALSGLRSLTYLDLSACPNLSDASALASSGNLPHLSDASGLASSGSLSNLSDASTPASSGSLPNLSNLSALAALTNLTYLNLSGTSITDLTPLTTLTSLAHLNLSGTQVRDARALASLTSLKDLNLSRNDIKYLPRNIDRLYNLKTLILEDAVLSAFPETILKLRLDFTDKKYRTKPRPGIYISGLKLTGQPIELFSQDRELIARYFKSRKENSPINECKVVFLGDGGVGKSLIIDRLMNDGRISPGFNGDTTPGICISDRNFRVGEADITLHFWDFGGQAIMHSMHRLFLTNRTLYVVVANARDDKANGQAWYWVRNIRSFAQGAPVLLLVNQKDQNPFVSVNENGLRKEYEPLRSVKILSALKDSREDFNRDVRDTILGIIAGMDTVFTPFPRQWLSLMDDLQNMAENYITAQAFYSKCEANGIEKNATLLDQIIDWYQDLGVCFYSRRHPASGQYMVLKPRWLLNALYILAFNGRKFAVNGVISEADIYHLICEKVEDKDIRKVWPDISYEAFEIQYILTVLLNYELIYRLDQDRFFIPMLCDENQPSEMPVFAPESSLHVSFRYDYLPENVLHRLMVTHGYELDLATIWRSGAVFERKRCGWRSFVMIRDNTLEVYVTASDPALHPVYSYIDMIRESVYMINEDLGLAANEYVIYHKDGREEAFSFSWLLGSKKAGQQTVYSETFGALLDIDEIIGLIQIPELLARKTFDTRIDGLLNAMIDALQKLQSNATYYGALETACNSYVRDILRARGYVCEDETHQGVSATGKTEGKPDILIRDRDLDVDLTIYEALWLHSFTKTDRDYLDKHIAKLLDNYNPKGLPYLFLASYVTWDKSDFDALANEYTLHLGASSVVPFKVTDNHLIASYNGAFLRCLQTTHACGTHPLYIYHLLVRVAR